jgi:hypothetical protein
MAKTGWYATCTDIHAQLTASRDYPLIREMFKDDLFCEQLDSLCAEARSTNDA